MSTLTVNCDCVDCESTFILQFMQEMVSLEEPKYCPFCGEKLEEIDIIDDGSDSEMEEDDYFDEE